MLLRLFNDATPVLNTTQKRQEASPVTPAVESAQSETPAETEEEAIKRENIVLGDAEQDHTDARETYTKAGDEEDRFNTTV